MKQRWRGNRRTQTRKQNSILLRIWIYSELRDSARNDLPEHVTAKEKPVLATSPHFENTHTQQLRSSQGLPRTSPASSEPRPRHGPRPRGAKSATFCSSRPGCEHQGGPEPQNCWSLETNLSVLALPHPRWASTPSSEAPYSRHPKTHQPRFPPLPPTSTTDP